MHIYQGKTDRKHNLTLKYIKPEKDTECTNSISVSVFYLPCTNSISVPEYFVSIGT